MLGTDSANAGVETVRHVSASVVQCYFTTNKGDSEGTFVSTTPSSGIPSKLLMSNTLDSGKVALARSQLESGMPPTNSQYDDWMARAQSLIGQTPLSHTNLLSSSSRSSFPSSNWIRRHLGTKSPYPHEEKAVGPLSDTPEGYELSQLHLAGTRYPSASKITSFQALADKLKRARVPGYEWLQRWSAEILYPISKGNLLAAKGDSDLYRIGRRFATRYKDFLDRYPYDANTYEFRSSAKSRCSQSAYGFSVGLLEGRHAGDPAILALLSEDGKSPVQPVNIFTLPIGMDNELAVKYACPRWLQNVKNQPKVVQEANLYQQKVLPELAEQLSVLFTMDNGPARVNFTTKDVQTIYGLCGFEIAIYDNDQTWCQLLRHAITPYISKKNDLDIEKHVNTTFLKLEVSSDLDDYYTHGPGVPFNRHLGCKLGTSLVESIELALAPDSANLYTNWMGSDDGDDATSRLFRGHFKFGHSETILFFSSFLGLYNQRGIPLTSSMTPEEYQQREFRSSQISPFASNVAFEVFRPKTTRGIKRMMPHLSDQDKTPIPTPGGLIRMLVNEEPMIIPGCGKFSSKQEQGVILTGAARASVVLLLPNLNTGRVAL
ncbi:PHOsphatase [Mortierella sp. GBA30]|nr:PHOsphatase [Mortierella sp. GBA30]